MDRRDRRDDWTFINAISLIAMGGWLLFRQVLGDFFPLTEIVRFVGRVFWPLALIAAGLLIYYSSRNRDRQAASGRLYRSRTERMVGGVLGGLGAYLGVDPTWLRIAFVLLTLAGGFGPGVLLYIIAMIVVPEEPVAGVVEPEWPHRPPVTPPPAASSGWPHTTGNETVQTPPPPPPAPGPADEDAS